MSSILSPQIRVASAVHRRSERLPDRCALRQAVTMIELLAAIAILSVVSAIAAVSLGLNDQQANMRLTARILAEVDGEARNASQIGGPIEMSLDKSGACVRLCLACTWEQLSETARPRDVLVTFNGPDSRHEVMFNSCGFSPDYTVKLRVGEVHQQQHICGRTGWIRQEVAP